MHTRETERLGVVVVGPLAAVQGLLLLLQVELQVRIVRLVDIKERGAKRQGVLCTPPTLSSTMPVRDDNTPLHFTPVARRRWTLYVPFRQG
jgi:hypothetical protein